MATKPKTRKTAPAPLPATAEDLADILQRCPQFTKEVDL